MGAPNRASHPRRLVGRENLSTDYNTGYRSAWYDADIPDRLPHEPHGIRSQAREHGRNRWSVSVTHGPHEEKDESGSYYKSVGSYVHEGPLGEVKRKLKADVNEQWDVLRRSRNNQQ